MMTCDRTQQYIADYLTASLPSSVQPEFAAHLGTCSHCREQLEAAEHVWRRLALLPVAEPSPEMRTRFYEMLDAEAPPAAYKPAAPNWFTRWLSLRPAFQFAGALALLVAGWFGGSRFAAPKPVVETNQVADLRKEVDQMRQLVALSLLQQQSASDRMKGVTWSYRVEPSDNQVVSALLRTVDDDPSVNVRLAAVDALQKFARQESVRQALVKSLPKQESPLVQIALIDLLAQLRDRRSVPALEQMAKDATANPSVRQRATWGVRQIV